MARLSSLNASRSDWAHFARWCVSRGETAIPASPSAIVEYIQDLAESDEPATVPSRVAAIRDWHRASGLEAPTDDERVRLALTRAEWHRRRTPVHTVPLDAEELATVLDATPTSLIGLRDRALLLIGYAAALRPSELVSLDVSDLTVVDDGLAVSLMRSDVVIPYGVDQELCPVLAWEDWEAAAGLTAGPAFRSVDRDGRLGLTRLGEKAITRIVQHAAERAGLDESRYSALSLRLGTLASARPG
jgi:site-specific recombinase XerD